MDVRTWMLVLFYFGVPSYILWIQWHLSAFTACSGTAMTEAISEFLAKDD